MSNQPDMEVRFLEPEEFHLIAPLFEAEKAAMPDPRFGKVLVAMDGDRIAGLMAAQMVLHVEPIIIGRDYRGSGIWKELAETMDGYLEACGVAGAYTQPVLDSTRHMCEMLGYKEVEQPLYLKLYDPELDRMFPGGDDL